MCGESRCQKSRRDILISLTVCGGLAVVGTAYAQELDEIEIIGVTPVHGSGIPVERYPANVQVLDADDIRDGGLDITDTMNRKLGSVHINAAQNNPLQPDVQYRGFTASPLLGLPQGLAVYSDGVRQNTPFGDTVHWDTIPQTAIQSMNLMPGSNPLFGLNTLGGALSIETKSGFSFDENRASLMGGSFDRWDFEAETGRQLGDWAYYVALGYLDENGWRDYSPSEAVNLFGKLSWQSDVSSLDLSMNIADTDLIGNGASPTQLLDIDRDAIFTRPDQTENELFSITLNGDTEIDKDTILAGNIYYRKHDISTLNGDDSDIEDCMLPINAGFLCIEDDGMEERVLDPDGNPIAAANSLEGATINTSKTEQDTYGASAQITMLHDFAGRENQLIFGAAWELGKADYRSQTELGSLDDSRFAVPGGVIDGDSFVDVETETKNYSLFFSNALNVSEQLTVTVAGRWNETNIELDDQIGTELNGDHTFNRFNPSVGATYALNNRVTLFGSYAESMRSPTAVELTCADPDDPCRLPNAFVSDPPLDEVVAKTFEIGARGRAGAVNWQVTAFTTKNEDDIIFISAGPLASEGYFDNIGDTRRRGIELGLDGRVMGNRLGWFVNYTYLDATFRSSFQAPSENHPFAVNDQISVSSGDDIPGIPEHLLKAGLDYMITPLLTVGGEVIYNGEQHIRGDESNQLDPVDDFAIVNLRGRYRLNDNFSVIARVDNVFDTDYETFGVLGEPDEVLGAAFDDPRFFGPGAPRAGWVGVEARF